MKEKHWLEDMVEAALLFAAASALKERPHPALNAPMPNFSAELERRVMELRKLTPFTTEMCQALVLGTVDSLIESARMGVLPE